MNSKRIINK